MNNYKFAALSRFQGSSLLGALLSGCLMVGLVGCGGPTADSESSSTPATTPVVNVSDEAAALLAKADSLDGATDQVIGKCYTCALGMDGDKANSVKVGDYTAHFCSEACSEHFVENAEELVKTTEIPESSDH